MPNKNRYTKVVDERFILSAEKGGGMIKFEAWEYQNEIIKYNMAYINKNIFPNDNGRVIGYDNSHNYHHKHYLGEIYEVDDFTSYEELVGRFQKDIQEFIQW
ncbi:MAG: transcriptional regulator [Epsilonproteobacteria bacterium]|nr:transcriptional regulator [Campylobacterota bacterium]